MLVEPVTGSGKSGAPPVHARLPADQGVAHADKETKKPVKEPNLSGLVELASDVQKNLNIIHNVDLQFTVHKASGQIMVTVSDGSSGKVIREIPPSEILQLAARLDEMIGMIFDKKG